LIPTQTTLKPSKKTRTVSRRLAEIHRRQAVHGKTRIASEKPPPKPYPSIGC